MTAERSPGAAGVVLTGGRSSRMGRPKAGLEWHGSTLLHRTVAVLTRAVPGPVVVVRAPGQPLPDLPPATRVVEDPVAGRGPVQGIAAGLDALSAEAEVAFTCSTDLPFLHPAFITRVLAELTDPAVDVALPIARGFRQPLAAGYRVALAGMIENLLRAGEVRPAQLFERCRLATLFEPDLLADPALARLDPELDSVINVNTPEEYAKARARPAPHVSVERYGALAAGGGPRAVTVQAATLGAAAAAAGLPLGRHVLVTLNGERVDRNPTLPLVTGDAVAFVSAEPGG